MGNSKSKYSIIIDYDYIEDENIYWWEYMFFIKYIGNTGFSSDEMEKLEKEFMKNPSRFRTNLYFELMEAKKYEPLQLQNQVKCSITENLN